MKPPFDTSLPFFAYGIFRPDQLGFFQIKPYVDHVRENCKIPGSLRLRDGLPILDKNGGGCVTGALLEFGSSDNSSAAYERISAMEPEKQYVWGQEEIHGTKANVLLGLSPTRGSILCEEAEWDGWKDPVFNSALDVVEESFESNAKFVGDLKCSFRLQMSYLLLWSAIERYVSLRYHFRDKATWKVNQLASEPAFALALAKHVIEERKIYQSDDPTGGALILSKDKPKKAVLFYYKVRSNLIHRGKGAYGDHEVVLKSGRELLAIFRAVLIAAQEDAHL